MTPAEKPCDGCGELVKFKHLKKLLENHEKKYYCKRCASLKRQNHRKETIKEAGITNEIRELNNKIQNSYYKPTGNPIGRKPIPKELKPLIKSKHLALALSKEDKQLLFKKHIKQGMSYNEADNKVKELNEYLIDLGKTLRANKKLSEEDKDKIFKEELNKVCYS